MLKNKSEEDCLETREVDVTNENNYANNLNHGTSSLKHKKPVFRAPLALLGGPKCFRFAKAICESSRGNSRRSKNRDAQSGSTFNQEFEGRKEGERDEESQLEDQLGLHPE
ncbi:hypothetical protein A2U01_0053152, partial [Trifolium medium]|nr:hypothetical protein [Trifolium medium]